MRRVACARRLDSTERRRMAGSVATQVYPEAQSDSLEILNSGDHGADSKFRVYLHQGRAAHLAVNAAILTLPYGQRTSDLKPLIREVAQRQPRRFTIDAGHISVS